MGFEKPEEPEIKLPTYVESWRKQRNYRKTSASASLTTKAFDCESQQTEKFLETRVPDHLTCLLRNLFAGQEAKVRTRPGKTGQFKTGKGVQGSMLLLCTFNLHAEFSSVAQSCPTLRPHELQHARPPCPSQTPRIYSKHMSIELVMPPNHLILCHPLLLLPPISPSIRVFSNESTLRMKVAKVLEFQLQHQSFQRTPRTDLL